VSDADDLEDASGSVSLMTLHTAKGLEYDAVFVTGVEEDLIPHRISAGEPGGPQEERRLFYVGITRARKRLYLSLAMTRAQFGEVTVAMPSRFLQEIPNELLHWRQSPGDVNSRGGTQSRALNAREGGATAMTWCRSRVASRPATSNASRTRSPPRCATTATWSWRRATASVTTTSVRDEWMPSPAKARSAWRTCGSTRRVRRSC
jgi:ATP-dependent exoDNAse (exonuclease V) beta subunit